VFGINSGELVVLLVVAAVVLGPERLPEYAQQLARLVKQMRRMAQGATEQVREELGPEFDDIDWRKLDPRQYDPRRIVRDALSDSVDLDDPLGLRQAFDDDQGMKPRSAGGPGDVDAGPEGPGRAGGRLRPGPTGDGDVPVDADAAAWVRADRDRPGVIAPGAVVVDDEATVMDAEGAVDAEGRAPGSDRPPAGAGPAVLDVPLDPDAT
jgi:sec-independent protein translocase protein TatB